MTLDEARKLVADFDKLLKETQELEKFIGRVERTNTLEVVVGNGQDQVWWFCHDDDYLGWRETLIKLLKANLKSMEVKVEDYKRRFR